MRKNKIEFCKAILKKKLYIISIAVIFAITGIAYTLANVEFVATKKILMSNSENINTYQEFLKGSELLENAIENSGMNLSKTEIEKGLEVNLVDNTNVIEIKITGEKADEIKAISDEMIRSFRQKIYEVYGEVSFYEIDNSGDFYSKGNTVVVGIVAFVSGLVLSSLFFVGCMLLDNKIKTCKEIEEITNLKSLISIPYIKNIKKKKLNIRNIRAHNSSVFKTLMTNIQFVDVKNDLKSKTILITSPKSFEGKTYVATNLAIEFAKAGKKVIMIDGDMKKGRLAKIFELPNDLGFSNYLSSLNANGNAINERINSFINDTEIRNLNVITARKYTTKCCRVIEKWQIKTINKRLESFL